MLKGTLARCDVGLHGVRIRSIPDGHLSGASVGLGVGARLGWDTWVTGAGALLWWVLSKLVPGAAPQLNRQPAER